MLSEINTFLNAYEENNFKSMLLSDFTDFQGYDP
jgi:hypothetical protein